MRLKTNRLVQLRKPGLYGPCFQPIGGGRLVKPAGNRGAVNDPCVIPIQDGVIYTTSDFDQYATTDTLFYALSGWNTCQGGQVPPNVVPGGLGYQTTDADYYATTDGNVFATYGMI